jgi:hypothetical protein
MSRRSLGFSGQVAQLVEQRTENPRVGSSILPLAMRALTRSREENRRKQKGDHYAAS